MADQGESFSALDANVSERRSRQAQQLDANVESLRHAHTHIQRTDMFEWESSQ